MGAPFTLREATMADIAAIGALAHKVWWAHYPGIIDEADIDVLLDKMYDPALLNLQMQHGHLFFLAEMRGELLGFIGVEALDKKLFIHKLYVDTEKHQNGVGSALLHHAGAAYPHLEQAYLFVNRDNAKAIAYYERRGFSITRSIDDDSIMGGPVKRDYEMMCPLPFIQEKAA